MDKSIDEDDDYDGDSEANVSSLVSHNEAASMLERSLVWLECQEKG